MKRKILVVDDESSMRQLLEIMLRKEGYDVVAAESRAAAAAALAQGPVDLVVSDIRLPDGDGIEILRQVRASAPGTVVVMMTAFGSTESAVAAMKLGAHDYLIKPFDIEELKLVVRNALEKEELKQENLRLKAELRRQHGLDQIIGVSTPMVNVFSMIQSVATTSSTVLLTGESGTGKELVAKALHTASPRREFAFVSVNCGALPENLLESELFGHMKGSFTDAYYTRKGLFEAAHRGTLFLDEVGETPAAMQVKLLRALQERKIRRVGGTEETEVDVRVIAATNRSLEELVRDRRFREDLFYRLNVIPIRIPPLRERREDIPLLARHFLDRFSQAMGKNVVEVSKEAMQALMAYGWPGNVRELENVMERAVALETTEAVLADRLPDTLRGGPVSRAPVAIADDFNLDEYMTALESELVQRALVQAGGDRARASRLLGITPRSLRYLIQKHRLEGLPGGDAA
jgi:two-component system, NtrC family, response regulator PilR